MVSNADLLALVAIFVLLAYAQALEVCGFGDRCVSFPADRTRWAVGGVVLSTVNAPGIATVMLVWRRRQLGAAVTAATRAGLGTNIRPVPDGEAGGAKLRLWMMWHAAVLAMAVQHRARDVTALESDEGSLCAPHHPRVENGHGSGTEVSYKVFGRGACADLVDDTLAGVVGRQNVRAYLAGSTFESDDADLVDFRRGSCSCGFDYGDVFLILYEETGGPGFRVGQMGGELQRHHEFCRPSSVECEPILGTKDQL